MKRVVWNWQLGRDCVYLRERSILTEVLDWVGSELINYGHTYSLGNRIINYAEDRTTLKLKAPITEEQARELGWDL